jgi:hypothetical protein
MCALGQSPNGRNYPPDQSSPTPYPRYARSQPRTDDDDDQPEPPPPPKRAKKQKPETLKPAALPALDEDDDPLPPPPPRNPGNRKIQRVQREAPPVPPDGAEILPPPALVPNQGPGNYPARQFMQGYDPGFGPGGMDCNGCNNWCNPNPYWRCPCGPCGPEGRFWLSLDLLLWWSKGQIIPPLLTTVQLSGPQTPNITNSGVIGQPGTVIAYGGGPLDETLWPGFRVRAGFWFDVCQMIGLEGSFFFLLKHDTFTLLPGPNLVISRPFFDTSTNSQNAELDNFPGVVEGLKIVNSYSQLYGADVNVRRALACCCNYRLDALVGFRFLGLYDMVDITENLTAINRPPVPAGTFIVVNDNFRTSNEFYGGQIGLAGEYREGRVFVDFRGLLALGATVERTFINGSTSFTPPGGVTTTFQGGLLAQPPAVQGSTQLFPSNIGNYTTTSFAVVPELAANVGFQATNWLRFWVGYTFLYWSNVVRAGEQIDLRVDSRTLPPLPNTSVNPPVVLGGSSLYQFHYNSYWAQGINIGTQFRY